ncbi:MAG TPA: divalent-cation tolerance protein CutA [Caulobacteraceae bacterium]|jgi:periplasmic divalent cation tolerance protein
MPHIMLLYTTWPDAESAEAAGAEAVAERLAACANILQPMQSIYRWQGAVERTGEIPMLLKTTAEAAARLREFLAARHPYETPCILALPVDPAASHQPFASWIAEQASVPAAGEDAAATAAEVAAEG